MATSPSKDLFDAPLNARQTPQSLLPPDLSGALHSAAQPPNENNDDDFNLDGLAADGSPEFELESQTQPATEPRAPQQNELQLPLENPEHDEDQPDTSRQFEFDGMAKPIYALAVENNRQQIEQLYFQKARTLLESLEAQNLSIPYQCRDGYCGACRCKKISGSVAYIKEPMAWINDDEILPCISVPKSDLALKLQG